MNAHCSDPVPWPRGRLRFPSRGKAAAPRVYARPGDGACVHAPAALDQPAIELARDMRQPSVFLGYYDVTSTVFYVRTDDRIGQDGYQWLIRRAVSERTGVSYR